MSAVTATETPHQDVAAETPRQRVLLLTHRFPYPPNRGDRIRSYNLLRVLSQHFDVTLACPHDEPISDDERAHVDGLCDQVLTFPVKPVRWARAAGKLMAGKSLTEGLFHLPQLHAEIQRAHQRQPFDSTVVFCSSMYPYVRGQEFDTCKCIVDLVDVDSEKWRELSRKGNPLKRVVYAVESKRVRNLENEVASCVDGITLVSNNEADVFRQVIDSQSDAIGISNGVDTDYFSPAKQESVAQRLVFTGVMDYPPNIQGMSWFCEQVFPRLRESHSELELYIVGRNPVRAVSELAKIPGVNVTGAVPDVRPYLHQATLSIAPLHLARGIQNKVLEAMATAVPVVTTPEAAEGINGVSGEHFVNAKDADEWIEAISSLLADEDHRTNIGKAARQLVLNQYAWSAKMQRFVELLNQ